MKLKDVMRKMLDHLEILIIQRKQVKRHFLRTEIRYSGEKTYMEKKIQ